MIDNRVQIIYYKSYDTLRNVDIHLNKLLTGRIIYTVYIMSDSYMGLDQQYDLQFELMDPLPPENLERGYDGLDKTVIE